MRRISMALALVGVVAAGCSMSKPSTSGNTGVAKGVAGSNYYVNLFTPPVGGVITSDIGGINCGASSLGTPVLDAQGVLQYAPVYYAGANKCGQTQFDWNTQATVVLTATAQGSNVFLGWAGDCSGSEATCTLTAGADKTVVAVFGAPGSAHGNFTDPAIHGPAFAQFAAGDVNALKCNTCHGEDFGGQGIAPSCATCHDMAARPAGGHGLATAAAWGDHGTGWTPDCLRCHTNAGYKDWLGVDGSANYLTQAYTGLVTSTLNSTTAASAPAGAYAYGPLQCNACHNSVTAAGITDIVFPSNVKVTTDKVTALCGQCHGARESTASVDLAIGAIALDAQMNATSGVSFKNPHYRGAAATMFGSVAKGWAQYPGMVYTGQNTHGVSAAKCTACHDPHGLEVVKVTATSCGRCHFDEVTGAPVTSLAQIEEQRQFGFEGDIDGDGIQAGLKTEIEGLNAKLVEAIQAYARDVVGQGVCYAEAYPYFLKHATFTGDCTAEEIAAGRNGAFKAFTPRLYRAAYNLKFSKTDSAAWAHNPRYAIEILYDAIYDLNAGLRAAGKTAVTFTGRRSFNGHFGSAGFAVEPYAQFLYHPAAGSAYGTPGSGFTTATCYQCHGGQGGLEQYLSAAPLVTNLTTANKVTGMQCATCHAPSADDADMAALRSIPTLYVPPQKNPAAVPSPGQVSFAAAALPPGFNLCATCHTGLENKSSVDNKIATMADPNAFTAGFVNGHYFGAAGIILGSDAKVLYEYPGKTYQGKAINFSTGTNGPHGSPHGARCTGCHDPIATKHSFEIDEATTVIAGTFYGAPNTKSCSGCHAGGYSLAPAKLKLSQIAGDLLVAMQTYAAANAGGPICYTATAYPYFIKDNGLGGGTAGDGICQAGEATRANGYAFDAKLLKAAYNYQWFIKDPGAAEHNYQYMGQALFDAIDDLGGMHSVVTVRP